MSLLLSSLAAKAVLALDLDTRELPLHLHREMEQYRRIKGEYTVLSVDFQMQRSDKQALFEKESKSGDRMVARGIVGEIIHDAQLERKQLGTDRWTATHRVDTTNSSVQSEWWPAVVKSTRVSSGTNWS